MKWSLMKTDRCLAWFGLACLFGFQPVIRWDAARAPELHVNPAELMSECNQYSGKLLNQVHCQIWLCVCLVNTASIGVCVCV